MAKDIDRIPRYVPQEIGIYARGKYQVVPVIGVKSYPPGSGQHGPIREDYTAVEVITEFGSRWFGFENAYINSQLRAVVVGFDKRDEVRMKWKKVPSQFR